MSQAGLRVVAAGVRGVMWIKGAAMGSEWLVRKRKIVAEPEPW